HLPAVPVRSPSVRPALGPLDHESLLGRVDAVIGDRARARVAASAERDDAVTIAGLEPPARQGEVEEHVGGEEPRRRCAGFDELHELGHDLVDGAGCNCHHDAVAAAMLRPTTSIVCASASLGLNSTTSVPCVTTGV